MNEHQLTLQKIKEIKELLNNKPQHKFLCGTEKIQYFDHLGEDCLKKYEEIPEEIKSTTLLQYLKNTLIKIRQEEFSYNQQSALNLCETILQRETKEVHL